MARADKTGGKGKAPKPRKKLAGTAKAPFKRKLADAAGEARSAHVHVYGHGVICGTDKRGHPTPQGMSPLEIVLDASEGFIPLWAQDTTLRWRFRESTLSAFENPNAAKTATKQLLGKALLAWGDAAPVRFSERQDNWDFEIAFRKADDCDVNGCVLASAFFPDGGRHELVLYPKLFEQPDAEQIDTLVHELGHVFGLRHFFAQVSETAWPSEVFGAHKPFSIMNYGAQSVLTDDDKKDLRRLYQSVWSGALADINGTPIRLVTPFSARRSAETRSAAQIASQRPTSA